MENKKLILGAVFAFLVLGIVGYQLFFQSDYASETILEADYQKAKEKIEKIIIESDYYTQVGGHDLEYKSKDSDSGSLRCIACDGFAYQFYTEDNKKVRVNAGFSKLLDTGKLSISYVDAYCSDEKDISYNLMTNEEDPLN